MNTPADTHSYVELRNINKTFGDYRASDDVSFSIEKGKLIGLLGPSGSGKTTILRILAGLETADSGDIYIDGKKVNGIPASKREIGFVFQNYALFPHMTVFENVAFGLKLQKLPKNEIRERVEHMLALVKLTGMDKRYPRQLSGGQQQRVAIARALALHPDILCFDEPTSALDPELTGEVLKVIRGLAEQKTTMIIVTHEMAFARDVADQVIFMDGGFIVEQGDPKQVIDHPQEERTKQFLAHYSE